MKNKQLWMGIFSFLGMLVLILDGKTAISATQEGINLCLQTVIPSLFPFLLLSILLTSAFSGQALPSIKPLCRLFNIPSGTESIFLSGFLGGYPVGAQCIGQAYRHGLLSQNTSLHMLRFCSNAGPAFLFGMVSNFFENRFTVWLLWLVHILSALLVAQCFPAAHEIIIPNNQFHSRSLSDTLRSALGTMSMICGWIIVFRIMTAFLNQWIFWLFPDEVTVAITGFLELSNGCMALAMVTNEKIRFLICACMLSFGGICVTMQTASVIGELPITTYLQGKLLQTIFSFIICLMILSQHWYLLILFIVFGTFFIRRMQKKSRIPAGVGV